MSQLVNTSNGGAGQHLFLNEEFSDVTILVQDASGNMWRFPVHSLMLASQSIVFRKMLFSDFSEKNNHQIVIEDIKPKTVELLLRYIYCGKVDLENWHMSLDLLQASHKYQIEPLVQKCGRFLENILTMNNVLYIYNAAYIYSLIQLREKCLKLILDAGFVILRSKAFELLNKDAALDIVASSCLNIDSELIVFEALLRWAPMQCCRMGYQVTEANILSALEPFLNYVCFDDMSDTEKSELPAAVLSCVKPNNRNRAPFCVPDSILIYTHSMNFSVNFDFTEVIGDSLNCLRFSLDSDLHMIGLKFSIVTSEFPQHFPLTMVKEGCGNSSNMFTFNLASAFWREGLEINERKCYETLILLRFPCYLEAKTVYKLYTVERSQIAQCPKMIACNKTLFTESRQINISLHSESIWGVMGLIFI